MICFLHLILILIPPLLFHFVRTEEAKTTADGYQGKPLNSPNDVIVAKDGAVWFTDPHYGIGTDYEGFKAAQELPCQVYRVDPSGQVEAVISDIAGPNGLAFSPGGRRLARRLHESLPQALAPAGWPAVPGRRRAGNDALVPAGF